MIQKEHDIITISELIDFIDRNTNDKNLKTSVEHLMNAISDWPTNISEPIDLIKVLKNEINDPLTIANIENYLKKLNANNDAWKMESLSGLIEIFNIKKTDVINKDVELEEILENLTKECRLS